MQHDANQCGAIQATSIPTQALPLVYHSACGEPPSAHTAENGGAARGVVFSHP
jgi:hypothetical protein